MGDLKVRFLSTITLIRLVVFSYLLLLSLFQTDPHHDGYILGAASGVTSGLSVHAGAFSQYGPMTPLVAGLFMKLFGVSVLTLRILAAILVFITYILIEKTLRRFEFKESTAQFFAISWIILNHVVSTTFDGSLFLWPSVISTLFLMISVYLACCSRQSKYWFHFLLLSGFFIALAAFTRIQSLLLVPGILFFFLLRRKFGKEISVIFVGFLLGCTTLVILLSLNGALDDFVYQAIVWPSRTYPSMGSGNNYNRFQFGLYVSLAIGMVIFYRVLVFLRKRMFVSRDWLFVVVIGSTVFAISWVTGKLLQSDQNTYLRLFVGDQLNRILLWPLYFSFAVTVLAAILALVAHLRSNWKIQELEFGPSYAILAGASVTVQIFPQSDVAHLWWITPLFIAPTLIVLRVANLNFSSIRLTVSTLLVASLFANLVYFSKDWERYSYKPLQGTFAFASKARAADIYLPLTPYLNNRKAVFVCYDGVHSVASGKYSSVDEWFVYWGFDPEGQESKARLTKASSVVVCDKERIYSDDIAKTFNKKIVYFAETREGDIYRSLAILENKERG